MPNLGNTRGISKAALIGIIVVVIVVAVVGAYVAVTYHPTKVTPPPPTVTNHHQLFKHTLYPGVFAMHWPMLLVIVPT